jgi:hypothetical protein
LFKFIFWEYSYESARVDKDFSAWTEWSRYSPARNSDALIMQERQVLFDLSTRDFHASDTQLKRVLRLLMDFWLQDIKYYAKSYLSNHIKMSQNCFIVKCTKYCPFTTECKHTEHIYRGWKTLMTMEFSLKLCNKISKVYNEWKWRLLRAGQGKQKSVGY